MKNTLKILALMAVLSVCFLFINFTVYSPGGTVYITGAVADGLKDDRVAVQNAINSALASGSCVDGQNKTYGINGSLVAQKNFCIKNARFNQLLQPSDTTPFIKCNLSNCRPLNLIADQYTRTGAPTVSGADLTALKKSRSIRTFLIRGTDAAPIAVTMENIFINKGKYNEMGSPSDAAGIWIDHAKNVYLNNIEITGKGHGPGILMAYASNVAMRNINIHDLTWGPYKGDRALKESEVNGYWNAIPIFDFNDSLSEFVLVRIQERTVGMVLSDVNNLLVEDSKISKLGSVFDTGFFPFQTDGMTLGNGTRNVTMRNLSITSTNEAIDLVGKANAQNDKFENHVYSGLTILDSFSFGFKIGYEAEDITLKDSSITNSAYAGVVVYGQAQFIGLDGLKIKESGVVNTSQGYKQPWAGYSRAGILVYNGGNNVSILNSRSDNVSFPTTCDYGFYRRSDGGYTTSYNSVATGCKLGRTIGLVNGSGSSFSNATGSTISFPGASCSLGGTTIASGSSIKAYQQGSLPAGYSCDALSQIRTCNNGVLSGSYTNLTCTVAAAKSCTLGGVTILSGQSIKAYWQGSLPQGYSCDQWSQMRTCNNGVLSGTYMNLSCKIQ
jgi:hypothetical protein